jgi:hypothetical protein
MSKMILADSINADGGSPHEIGSNERGVGFIVSADNPVPQRFKTYYLSDSAQRSIASLNSNRGGGLAHE